MATSSQTTELRLGIGGLDSADAQDRADKFVCVLFVAATILGAAWFYWHVMCSAQRTRGEPMPLQDLATVRFPYRRLESLPDYTRGLRRHPGAAELLS